MRDRGPGALEFRGRITVRARQQVEGAGLRVANQREIRVRNQLEARVADRGRDRRAVHEKEEGGRFHDVDRRRLVVEALGRRRFQHAVGEVVEEDVERHLDRLAFDGLADARLVLRRSLPAGKRHALDFRLRDLHEPRRAIHRRLAGKVDRGVARVLAFLREFDRDLCGEVLELVPAADLRRVHDDLAAVRFARARVLPARAQRGIRRLPCLRGRRVLRRAVAGRERRERRGGCPCNSLHAHRWNPCNSLEKFFAACRRCHVAQSFGFAGRSAIGLRCMPPASPRIPLGGSGMRRLCSHRLLTSSNVSIECR